MPSSFTIKSLTNRKGKLEAILENFDSTKEAYESELEIINEALEKYEALETEEKPAKKTRKKSKKADLKLAANG